MLLNSVPLREYHRFTNYEKEPGAYLRLDRIVDWLDGENADLNHSQISILDFGCGTGNISRAIASLGYRVLGMDVDPNSIQAASAENPFENLVFKVADVYQLPSDKVFDVVICSEVIEHFAHPGKMLKQMHRILKPDGLLLATIPNGFGPEEIVRRFLSTTTPGKKILTLVRRKLAIHDIVQTQNFESPHLQYFSLGKFRKLLNSTGFRVIDVSNWTAFFLQSYYLFMRLFIQRGSHAFERLNTWDRYLADLWPLGIGGGWFFAARKTNAYKR
jgi:2-polyprenyl-3-methyl-5-hydroxy-6-metoxy-1,4-benzoquinol methylase